MEARAPETTPYPADALAWLAGDPAVDGSRTVLVVGAPDPALSQALVTLGHDVRTDDADTLPDDSVDVVVAVHGPPADLDEAARVLRPGGRVAFAVPGRDLRIPWVRKLDRILGTDPRTEEGTAAVDPVTDHEAFDPVEDVAVRFWQHVDRPALLDLAGRLPELRDLGEAEREERLAAVGELYDGYGRGPDGMRLPWVTHCHRARLADRPAAGASEPDRDRDSAAERDQAPAARDRSGWDLAADTDMLLIDFR